MPKKMTAPAAKQTRNPCQTLAPRERQIVALLSLTDKAIADRLGLKPHSVTSRLPMLYRKLQVESRTAAALKWQAWVTQDVTLRIP